MRSIAVLSIVWPHSDPLEDTIGGDHYWDLLMLSTHLDSSFSVPTFWAHHMVQPRQ